MRRIIVGGWALLVMLCCGFALRAQEGCVTGKVVEADSSEAVLIGATVKLLVDGEFVAGEVADFDGYFTICGLPDSGTYDLQVDYTGYATLNLINIPLGQDSILLKVHPGVNLHGVFGGCIFYKTILYETDDMTSGQTFSARQVRRGLTAPRYSYSAYENKIARRQKRAARKAGRAVRTKKRMKDNN